DERRVERRRAARHGDAVRHVVPARELLLEASDVASQRRNPIRLQALAHVALLVAVENGLPDWNQLSLILTSTGEFRLSRSDAEHREAEREAHRGAQRRLETQGRPADA